MTRDVDITVTAPSDTEAEALVFDLQGLGYGVIAVLEQKGVGRLATVRLKALEPSAVVVDLLFASSGIEPEVTERAERLEVLPTLIVPVATVSDLLALKVLARDDRRRPQDWDDIRALLAEATPVDIDRAKAALRLIEQRGYHRGKRLVDSFDEILQDHR